MEPFDVLRDPASNTALSRLGYARLDGTVVASEARNHLIRLFHETFPGGRDHFHNDFFIDSPAYRARATVEMAAVTAGLVERFFVGFDPFLYTYLVKFAGARTGLSEHRDWMYVDEPRGARSYILYIALDEVGADQGGLHLVPRSHLLDGPPCGTRLFWPWLEHAATLREHAVRIDLRPGEAAIWDNRLVHMSFPNETAKSRVAIGLWCRRRGDQLTHFHWQDGDDVVRQFCVDEHFYLTETPQLLASRPPDYPVIGEYPVRPFEATVDELCRALSGSDDDSST